MHVCFWEEGENVQLLREIRLDTFFWVILACKCKLWYHFHWIPFHENELREKRKQESGFNVEWTHCQPTRPWHFRERDKRGKIKASLIILRTSSLLFYILYYSIPLHSIPNFQGDPPSSATQLFFFFCFLFSYL